MPYQPRRPVPYWGFVDLRAGRSVTDFADQDWTVHIRDARA